MLAFTMVVAPTDNGDALIQRVDPTELNEIDDQELFECIEQTSFTLEGLDAPEDFVITMPIDAAG